jgi:hypothetical protein
MRLVEFINLKTAVGYNDFAIPSYMAKFSPSPRPFSLRKKGRVRGNGIYIMK